MALKSFLRVAALSSLFAIGLSGSALACKGATTLLRDDFTDEDPAWGIDDHNLATVADGALKMTTQPGHIYYLFYQGINFPGADACVDIVNPSAADKQQQQAGFGIW